MSTAFTYTPPASRAPVFYPGVPMGDLSQDVYDALPTWLQTAISGAAIYAEAEEE